MIALARIGLQHLDTRTHQSRAVAGRRPLHVDTTVTADVMA